MWKTWVRSLGWEDPLEKETATHSSTLAWKIPWTEEPGGLQSAGSQRGRHDWATSLSLSFIKLLLPLCLKIVCVYSCSTIFILDNVDYYLSLVILENRKGSEISSTFVFSEGGCFAWGQPAFLEDTWGGALCQLGLSQPKFKFKDILRKIGFHPFCSHWSVQIIIYKEKNRDLEGLFLTFSEVNRVAS